MMDTILIGRSVDDYREITCDYENVINRRIDDAVKNIDAVRNIDSVGKYPLDFIRMGGQLSHELSEAKYTKSMYEQIQEVTQSEFEDICKNDSRRGSFYLEITPEGAAPLLNELLPVGMGEAYRVDDVVGEYVYLGVSNLEGNAWVHGFKTITDCKMWLSDEMMSDYDGYTCVWDIQASYLWMSSAIS